MDKIKACRQHNDGSIHLDLAQPLMADDDFTVESLAAYLHLTPSQVEKMASRGRLPARRVGGRWIFSANEIHHWFEDKIGVSDPTELVAVETVLDRQHAADGEVIISHLLQPMLIRIPLDARTKNSVIERMCTLAANGGVLWDEEKMISAIRSRESMHPTALENGVALLHPRRPMNAIVGEPFLALGITTTGLPFGGPRGSLTDIFFLIGSTSEQVHLRTLARLSRLISVGDLLDSLRESDGPAEAWNLIKAAEQDL